MPNLAELLADDEASTLKIGHGEVHLRTITPDLLTGEIIDLLAELDSVDASAGITLQDAATFLTKQATLISKIVTWWDATDPDGQPVPLVVSEIKKQPKKVLAAIIQHVASGEAHRQALEGEGQPGEQMKLDSEDTSSRQAKSDTVPIGIPASKPEIASTSRPGSSSRTSSTSTGTGGGRLRSLPMPQNERPGKAPSSPRSNSTHKKVSGE